MSKPYHDKETLRRLYHDEGLDQSEIAAKFGVNQGTISDWMSRLGVETDRWDEPYHDPDTLERLYHDEGLTQTEIADRFGVAANTISEWFTKHGITTRPSEEAPHKDPDILRRLHHREGLSWREMADRLGVGTSTIQYWMNEHGIESLDPNREKYDIPEDELRELYIGEQWSSRECADHFGCTPPIILNRLRDYGIPVRSNTEARRAKTGEVVPLNRNRLGHHRWEDGISGKEVRVHQLTAIAHGADPHKVFGGYHVHHRNVHPSDDRPDNLEVLTNNRHIMTHRRNEWTEENGFPVLVTASPGETEE